MPLASREQNSKRPTTNSRKSIPPDASQSKSEKTLRLKGELSTIASWAPERSRILRDALQLSLMLQHERCVGECIEAAAPVHRVDLLAIYDKLFDEMSPPL